MTKHRKYTSSTITNNVNRRTSVPCNMTDEKKRQFKKELMDVFQKFGYLLGENDHEVTFKTTSGNIAWININRIEIIK